MVFVVLTILWLCVLVPLLLRRFSDRAPHHSVGAFRRQLKGLRPSGKGTIPPAHRLHGPTANLLVPPLVPVERPIEPYYKIREAPLNVDAMKSPAPRIERQETLTSALLDTPPLGSRVSMRAAFQNVQSAPEDQAARKAENRREPASSPQAVTPISEIHRRRRMVVTVSLGVMTVVTLLAGLLPGMHSLLLVALAGLIMAGLYISALVKISTGATRPNRQLITDLREGNQTGGGTISYFPTAYSSEHPEGSFEGTEAGASSSDLRQSVSG